MKENQKNGRRMDGRETEEKIIECAGQLIAEKGFASVTSKEICRAAGVNLAAVNYHFGSRDGLYLAVLENVQQYLVGLQQLIDLYESDLVPRQKMEKLIDFLAGNVMEVCKNRKIRIPEDLKLASFYNSSVLDYASPAVTSLDFNDRKLGAVAIRTLLDRIEGREVNNACLKTYEVMLRESTK